MPIDMGTPTSQDGGLRTYWLQVLQAGHWRNLEQIQDAGNAMIRTGTLAQGKGFDAVRLLEARFHAWKGQTEFHEIVVFDTAGAHFAAASGKTGPDHARMDLAGTIAPLLPSARVMETFDAPATAQVNALEQAPLPVFQDARTDRAALIPTRHRATPAGGHATASASLPRTGTRARLLTGVMAGAFVAGVALSSLSPQQSGGIAAAIYERIGASAEATLALAPKLIDAAGALNDRPEYSREAEPQTVADAAPKISTEIPAAPVAPAVVTVAAAPAVPREAGPVLTAADYSAASGQDLEAEFRQQPANMVAASLAVPVAPVLPHVPQTAIAVAPAKPAKMTEEQAFAMQASLPLPVEHAAVPAAGDASPAIQIAKSVPNAQPRASSVADQGLRLAPASANPGTSQTSAFTTAVAGDASQLTAFVELPRAPRRPDTLRGRAEWQSSLAGAIENGTVEDMLTLISGPVRTVSVASLSDQAPAAVVSAARPDLTSLLDFALLQGRPAHAEALATLGVKPSDRILDTLARSGDRASLTRIAPIIRKIGIDPDRPAANGVTALMQAAHAGDARRVEALLTLGADPAFETGNGLRAADFAARANHVAVQESLVLATDQSLYTPIMFGLTWSDTLETVKARSDVCKRVGEGFMACSLKAESWLDDTAAIIAQFDTRNGNRLVAIQVDSHLYDNPDEAEVGFKKAAQLIAKVLPADQFGFPVRDIPPDAGMFHSLTPSVGAGQYFQYWPDDNLRRPVYVHMKMIGYKHERGFHRIVIGNPFRVG